MTISSFAPEKDEILNFTYGGEILQQIELQRVEKTPAGKEVRETIPSFGHFWSFVKNLCIPSFVHSFFIRLFPPFAHFIVHSFVYNAAVALLLYYSSEVVSSY